jgi:hypothetical protein
MSVQDCPISIKMKVLGISPVLNESPQHDLHPYSEFRDCTTGETYCIAHRVSASQGKRMLFIASLRYYDVFAKVEGKWLFAECKIMVDWTEDTALYDDHLSSNDCIEILKLISFGTAVGT